MEIATTTAAPAGAESSTTTLVIAIVVIVLALLVFVIWRKGRKLPGDHVFRASRLSQGNRLIPTQVAITPQWKFGLNVAAFSSSYFRGDESNLNRKLPAYAIANLNTSVQLTKNVEVFALVTNLFNTRVPNFGTFLERTEPGELFANRYALNDPRTTALIQPLSVYGGMRVTW